MFSTHKLSRFVIIFLLVILCSLITEAAFAKATDDAGGTILYVKPDGISDCSSWAQACNLQTALTNAAPGDEIWVAAGTYKPTTFNDRTATFALKSSVAIYGGFPAEGGDWSSRDWENNDTILSGDIGTESDNTDNSYHVVTASSVNKTAVLDGFTITAGNALDESYSSCGAGMLVSYSSPTLSNIIFLNNLADNAGGMYNSNSNPTLTNITFSGNIARYTGGGMGNNVSSPTLTNVTFTSNKASGITGYGGGMDNYNNSNPILINVIFSSNVADSYGGGMYNDHSSPSLTNVTFSANSSPHGGGIYNYNQSHTTLTNVTFSNNNATTSGGGMLDLSGGNPTLTNVTFTGNSSGTTGAGMVISYSTPTLTNVTFSNNAASSDGGGIYVNYSSPTLTNVTFSANTAGRGGGMYIYSSSPALTNVTMLNNTASSSGGGIYSNSGFTVINSILWGNVPDQVVGGSPSITYSDIQGGGFSGEGNINADPLLGTLANNGGFTQTHALLSGSPAIDSGSPDVYPQHDQRFFTRPVDGDNNGSAICDMGAYEYNATAITYVINITIEGYGSVSKNPDKTSYNYGDVVELTAIPSMGSYFDHWSGDASGSTNPVSFIITHGITITAHFTQFDYTLTVTVDPEGKGAVSVIPAQETYHYGDVVELTATPALGWSFANWTGDATGTTNPVSVTITGNTSVTAHFTQNEYTLSVTVDPEDSGTVSLDPEQATYHYGDVVELTAVPELGWSFAYWSGDAAGTDNPISVTITGDMSVTANFTQDEYTLTVLIAPENGGSVTINPVQQTYHYGDQVTITATANPFWSFAGWSGDAAGSDNPLTITITSNTEITANFQKFWLYLPLISR